MPAMGVFTRVIRARSVEEVAERVRRLGLTAVQLDPELPGIDPDPLALDAPTCRRIRQAFHDRGIAIAALSGYANLLHPDAQQRRRSRQRFRRLLQLARELGTDSVATETGTYHATSDWADHPDNTSPRAWAELVEVCTEMAPAAEAAGVSILFEPYVKSVVRSAQDALRLHAAVGSPVVRFIVDPAGLLTSATMQSAARVLEEAFETLAGLVGLVHVEDVRFDAQGEPHFVGAGRGSLDYALFMRLVRRSGYAGPLILEHLDEDEVPACRDHVARHLQQALRSG